LADAVRKVFVLKWWVLFFGGLFDPTLGFSLLVFDLLSVGLF
jgi:hypothetical protein